MTTAIAGKQPGLWLRILRWPVEPSSKLDDLNRRNASLLLGLELVVMFALTGNMLFAPYVLVIRIVFGLLALAYAITHTRYYQIGGSIAIGILSLMVLALLNPDEVSSSEHVSGVMVWTVLPVVIASMFFSVRGAVIVALINLGIVFLSGVIIPGMTPQKALAAAGFPITIVPLLIVAVNHRNQLEKLRQAELKAANDALIKSEAVLEQRVIERTTEIDRARREADDARHRAEQADQVKSQFLASMSHELRTPLNAILNFTEMMALGMVGDVTEQQKDILGKSLNSGKHLLDLINDVLDVSKMQSGMLTLFVEQNVNLRDELATVNTAALSLLKDKPVKLIEEIEDGLPTMSGDRRRIRQIMFNLVSNAAKFTENGSITVIAKKVNGDIRLGVVDTGPGIAEDEQERIFLPFVQTETGIRHMGGTGLGLAISKHLAEAHGGRLWVESSPGKGAAFYVSLPLNTPVREVKP